jgi:CRP-like cAMP-binding protein
MGSAVADILRRSEVFSRFDDETLERFARHFAEVDIPENQVLIEPRMTGAGLFVICEGAVEVDSRGVHRELGPGDVIGEISLVEADGERRARVSAKTAVRCLAASRTAFDEMIAQEPALGAAVRELARKRIADLEAG